MSSSRFFAIYCAVLFLGLVVASPVMAYEARTETVPVPYEVVPLTGAGQVTSVILGELKDSPEMFEIVVVATSTLMMELRAVPVVGSTPTFSSIIIKQKEIRGIEQVARLAASDASWQRLVDWATGLPYLAGPSFAGTVTPGTYRIEVSNPSNQGKYLLLIGSGDDSSGYLTSLRSVVATYEFYGTSKLKLFNSPYVYYPTGIGLLLLVLGVLVYKNRQRFITSLPENYA